MILLNMRLWHGATSSPCKRPGDRYVRRRRGHGHGPLSFAVDFAGRAGAVLVATISDCPARGGAMTARGSSWRSP